MMIRLIANRALSCLILFSVLSGAAGGQTLLEEVRSDVVLKIAPLPLFDIYNTAQVGIEIPFKDSQFTFQQELGYGHTNFSIWYAEDESRPDRHHVRSRTQLRYYFREWNKVRVYLAGEYFLRNSITRNHEWRGTDCDNWGGCAYFTEQNYKTGRIAHALHAKFGFQFWLSERIAMEFYTGLGVRQIQIKSLSGNPPEWFRDDTDAWWEPEGKGVHGPYPSVAMGFQLGIRLGK